MMRHYLPIYQKILLFFLLLVLGPLWGVSWLAKYHAEHLLNDVIGHYHLALAKEKARAIELLFENYHHQAWLISELPIVRNALLQRVTTYQGLNEAAIRAQIRSIEQTWEEGQVAQRILTSPLSLFLHKLQDGFPEQYAAIYLTDAFGATVAMSQLLPNYTQAHEFWWQEATRIGRNSRFIEDQDWDKTLQAHTYGIAVPIRDETQQLLGVIKFSYPIKVVWSVLGNHREKVRLIRSNDPTLSVYQQHPLPRVGGWRLYPLKDNGGLSVHATVHIPVYHHSRHETVEHWQQVKWVVRYELEPRIAFIHLFHLRDLAWLLSAGLMIVILLSGLWFSHTLVIPLQRLRIGVEAVGAGRLDTRVGRVSVDEIGEVALAFDRTTERLQTTLASKQQLQAEVEERRRVEQKLHEQEREKQTLTERLQRQNQVLAVIGQAQALFIRESDPLVLFNHLLQDILTLTDSEIGFIGDVLQNEQGDFYLKCYAFSHIAQPLPNLLDAEEGLVFTKLDNLFGQVITSGKIVMNNDLNLQNANVELPCGHPPIHSFLGLPVYSGQKLVGEIALANRKSGYQETCLEMLQPVIDVCGQIITARWEQVARQQMERQLAETTQRYRTLFELCPDGLVVLDPKTAQHIEFNQAAVSQLGYTPEEFKNLHIWDYEACESPRDIATHIHRIEQFGRDDFETLHKRKDGEVRNMIITAQFVEMNKRRHIFSVIRDVTEQKLGEQALRENERRLQFALDAAQAGMLFFDVEKNHIEWDDRSLHIFGLSRERFGNSYESWAACLYREDLGEVETFFATALQDPSCNNFTVQYRIMRFGEIRHVKVQAWIQRAADHTPRWVSGLHFDITEQVIGEETLTKAKEAAEAATQAKNLFLANMSHELRTPLNAIMGFSRLLHNAPECPVQFQENLAIIHRSGEHLLHMINDVLDISKIEAGRMSVSFETFHLPHLIQDIEQMLRSRMESKSLQFQVKLAPSLPVGVRSDPGKIRQILINLLTNALKYTEQGGVTLHVSQQTLDSGACMLCMNVEDSGVGIASQMQDKVFEAFIQVGNHTQEGTGLGLAITRQFVELLEGEITLHSEPGYGSTFSVRIPVQIVENWQEHKSASYKLVQLAPKQPEYRMLVVEDHEANRSLLCNLLSAVGLTTQAAENGREGVNCFRTWQPHLVWMDIRMPVMDGLQAVREMRALPMLHPCRFIAVSASIFREQRSDILAAGFDDFLRKPYRDAEIYHLLEHHLNLCFEYEEPRLAEEGLLTNQVPRREISAAEFAKIAPHWREDFQLALVEGDLKRLENLTNILSHDHPLLAQEVVQQIKQYEFEHLLMLLHQSTP